MRQKIFTYTIIGFLIISHHVTLFAQKNNDSGAPALSAIQMEDLKRDLIALCDDHFLGRKAGTIDELRAAAWLTDRMRETGMQAAGEDGTFTQFFNLSRKVVMPTTRIAIDGRSFKLWSEVIILGQTRVNLDAPTVYVGKATPEEVKNMDLKGKAVIMEAHFDGSDLGRQLFFLRYSGEVLQPYYDIFREKGVVAVIMVADDYFESNWNKVAYTRRSGSTSLTGPRDQVSEGGMPILWVHSSEREAMQQVKGNLIADIRVEQYLFPSVNLVGKIEGTDPQLKNEYVVLSGHHDYLGIQAPIGNDSICNGADDNGSVCVALLAMARAFKEKPSKRSILFIIHGAEEMSMLGARWFVANPTVPFESMVAVLNGDLIANNHPDSAAVLGCSDAHRTSNYLVEAVLAANQEGPKFKLDQKWDKADHPEYFYYRSDHAPYASRGVPVLFFTTLLHPLYHTPLDDVDHIDFNKLYRMTEWMYRTAWKVANHHERPDVIVRSKE